MPLVYYKLLDKLKENGYTTYRIRKEKLLGQRTLTALKHGEGNIDNKTLEKFCELFDCQPGDLMEYIHTNNNWCYNSHK